VAVLAYTQELVVGESRWAGCIRALTEVGLMLDPALVRRCEPTAESAAAAAADVLISGDASALIATNIMVTRGALRAIVACGLRVPEDVSLVGFDETELTRLHVPPITVVKRDVEALARRAVYLLIDRIEGRGSPALTCGSTAVRVVIGRLDTLRGAGSGLDCWSCLDYVWPSRSTVYRRWSSLWMPIRKNASSG
jgi:LacI family transcriptional regulator